MRDGKTISPVAGRGSSPACLSCALVLVALVLALTPGPGVAAPAQAHVSPGTETGQPLLLLEGRIAARSRPAPDAPAVALISGRTPLTNSRTVLPVVRSAPGPAGGRWVEIRLPSRPNGATGWVPAYAGSPASTAWRIVVHRGLRAAVVWQGDRPRARFRVVVGKAATPTPLGTYFVVEKLRLAPGVAEGPWVLTTSAYSNVLQEFAGGPGQIALHGVVGLTAPLGSFSSHGCVRFANAAITWIAAHVDAGTPLIVER